MLSHGSEADNDGDVNSPIQAQLTMLHHVNHASFSLPEKLKDRTTHTFVSFDDEAGEFSVVMSHAHAHPENTLADFADDLIAGRGKAMPDFSLLASMERTLAGRPAIELTYRWRNGFTWLHQRQVFTLVPGVEQGDQQALLITATCPPEFAGKWHATFEAILGSVKLRERPEAVAIAPAINVSTVFALRAGRRILHAFASREDACLNTDAGQVQEDAWRFFDAAGKPLHARFVAPRAWWRKPDKYVLEMRPAHLVPSLRDQLQHAEAVVCHAPFVGLSSIAEVRTTLDNLTTE